MINKVKKFVGILDEKKIKKENLRTSQKINGTPAAANTARKKERCRNSASSVSTCRANIVRVSEYHEFQAGKPYVYPFLVFCLCKRMYIYICSRRSFFWSARAGYLTLTPLYCQFSAMIPKKTNKLYQFIRRTCTPVG